MGVTVRHGVQYKNDVVEAVTALLFGNMSGCLT
jgi:hypothetical protein